MEVALSRWESHKILFEYSVLLRFVIIARFCLKICSKALPSWLDY